MNELPIIQKTYDFIKWYVPILNRLPLQEIGTNLSRTQVIPSHPPLGARPHRIFKQSGFVTLCSLDQK
jgi:hypothetical protein